MTDTEKYLRSIDKSLQSIAKELEKITKRYKTPLPSITDIDLQLTEQYREARFIEPEE